MFPFVRFVESPTDVRITVRRWISDDTAARLLNKVEENLRASGVTGFRRTGRSLLVGI